MPVLRMHSMLLPGGTMQAVRMHIVHLQSGLLGWAIVGQTRPDMLCK